ncbi:hypothetical protein P8452_58613 [Trifolium repens]|nr:hypothetical protein P8452_58613 [Trifolium repens]
MVKTLATPPHRILMLLQQSIVEWCSSLILSGDVGKHLKLLYFLCFKKLPFSNNTQYNLRNPNPLSLSPVRLPLSVTHSDVLHSHVIDSWWWDREAA